MARDREREVKIKKFSRKFSRNENLAGGWDEDENKEEDDDEDNNQEEDR